jgi:signal transduction histidine kinase
MRYHVGTNTWSHVAVVLSSVAGSGAVAYIFKLQDRAHFLPLTIGVIVSSWYGGLVPGLAATILGLLVAVFFTVHVHTLVPADLTDIALLALFLAVGVAISLLRHWLLKTNVALRESVQQLRRSNEELERFSFVLAHDLLAPLRSIQAMTQLFLRRNESNLDKDSAQELGFVVSGADRMKRLIEDILEFAKAGHDAQTSRVDPQAAAESALRFLQEAVDQSGAKITISPLPMIQANEGHLVRLFLNLIGNAIKYQGQNPPEIHISATSEHGKCVFSVRDNGIGIEPKYHSQIFDPFRRLHSSSQYEGSGVGLAICKRIVERYGGRIRVESQPGKGSTFYFTMPIAVSSESPGQDVKRKPIQTSPPSGRGKAAAG